MVFLVKLRNLFHIQIVTTALASFPHYFQPPQSLSTLRTLFSRFNHLPELMTLVPYSRRFLNTKTLSSDSNDHGPDLVVVLAALVCGTACLLSLIAAVRCAWISHFSGRSTRSRTTTSATQSQGNKAPKKKFLRKIPKVTYTGSAEDGAKFRDCAICLTEFIAGDVLRVLPQCGHGFHVVCVDMWLRSHSSCPSCRQILGDSTANEVAGVENNHIPLTVR